MPSDPVFLDKPIRGLLAEWITVFAYYYLLKCFASVVWAIANVITIINLTNNQNGAEVDVGIIIVLIYAFLNILINFLLVMKMILPLREYALECRSVRLTGRNLALPESPANEDGILLQPWLPSIPTSAKTL
ncbi:hypothetical protein BCR33DRAFT_711381 [Rhizoclosmatium globosum]|uniref:Uncharacterized protein n=1 Tax=Rhizoclosmatium globosum TaxID=329046 RepID=A0A1Y2D1I7_9FUNG|nr:hypothetical protein BCR33DRAFT_711381 [Rhizoclosmatium globosum]|eukprot:ORY52976.1 hypothetical protein BCR33DRAFT_711381 [Rhizoclosmatium globosum]